MSEPFSPEGAPEPNEAEPSQETPVQSENPQATPLEETKRGSKTRQLLGMKGAQQGESNIWKIRLQLMKPITWVPLIWGVVCGAASSGNYTWSFETILISAACMLMSGPCLTGYTQTNQRLLRSRHRCHKRTLPSHSLWGHFTAPGNDPDCGAINWRHCHCLRFRSMGQT